METRTPDGPPSWTTQPLGLVALRRVAQKLQRVTRYRLARARRSRFKRRFLANGLVLTYRAGGYARHFGNTLRADFFRHLATALGLLIGVAFVVTVNDAFLERATFSAGEFHLACAGIMGTGLALVLSLSIVPAQKAADVFSSAILQLYAQDRALWNVFAWLASLTLVSVLLGTGWTFGVDPRWTIVLQLVLLGIALDQLRAFYLRALELLNPQTALGLVREHCHQLLKVMVRDSMRVTRIFQVAGGKSGALEPSAAKWLSFRSSPATQRLIQWIHQLEEFAHKAVARRDTQATTSALATMTAIGIHYAEVRRDSIVLVPEFAGFMPVGVSDVGIVLDPIYESIKTVCEDAARQPNEAVVIACIRELGRMAAHFMTIVHTRDGYWATAPFAYSPIFYIKACALEATKAKMDDASLAAIRAVGPVYEKISDKVQTLEAETTAIDYLFEIALGAYIRSSWVPAEEAVKMMLAAARHELKVRDFDQNKSLKKVLANIAFVVPFEVRADQAGQRLMQVFAPYAPHSGLRGLLVEEAQKIKPEERDWVDPFHDFAEVSEEIVHHYREVAKQVTFDGVMLERWIVGSALDCAEVHVALLEDPPQGTENFLHTVEDRLIWFIRAPSFFFNETKSFPYHHAEGAAGRLAIIGMRLLQLDRPEAAKACAQAIGSIGNSSASVTNAKGYFVADIFDKLEVLSRAADALGHANLAKGCRAMEKRAEIVGKVPEYEEAIRNRTEHLDESLAEHPFRDPLTLPDDPVPLLRQILRHKR